MNKPIAAVNSYHADGPMRLDAPKGTDAYCEPNPFGGPVQQDSVRAPPLRISGDADRYDHRDGNDDYSQPADLFRLFDAGRRQRFFSNIAAAMQGVPREIIDRQIVHFRAVDPAWADGVEAAMKATHTTTASAPLTAADVAHAAE